jgi:hypothetical protein
MSPGEGGVKPVLPTAGRETVHSPMGRSDQRGHPVASVDDVNNLLNAVNSVTLKRMEDKADANQRRLTEMLSAMVSEIRQVKDKLGIPS